MKKTFISASVASVLALASFGALAEGPSFYGRLDLAVTTTDSSTTLQGSTNKKNPVTYGDSGTYLENNFSWLGVKGSEKVADGVDIVYQMEFGVDNTTNSSDTFNARNTFLGFKTVAGTVLAGRNDTVFKQAEGNVDVFGNTNADIDRLVSAQAGAGRSGDGVWYYSPKLADLVTLNATYLFDDNYEGATPTSDSMYAVSATLGDKAFKEQNYYLAAAYNKAIGGVDAYRGVAQAKFGDFTVGGLFQHAESIVNDNRDGNSYFVNVVYKLQSGVNLKAEYGKDEAGFGSYFKNASTGLGITNAVTDNLDDVNVNQITIGADYRLVKSTLLFAHYAHYEGDFTKNGVKQDLIEDDVVSIGVRYDF